ncbi:hypothetical protein GI374_07690 [Paracoccus sp. S-4012]|uniref:hypothetical protein n=1 Tax=Paracoccus sp. S-4012 TaxID=2665648 RepID=UPI0012B04216|nr:hypothetical protein [Paracoccus sp. S-4012]MRX50332.1 hypothetical protein [Paracoccus sp. S-4012]
MSDAPEEAVRAVWPGLSATTPPKSSAAALPPPDADLAPFLEARIPGPEGPTWAGRRRDLARHFRDLQPEFAGRLRIAHLLACCIVALRRQPKSRAALTLFHRITAEHGPVVAPEMNLRWLTSVCDTFCDFGTPRDRAIGLSGTLIANFVKLAETERRMFTAPRPWPPERAFVAGGPLFDGVICYWVGKGDMIANLLDRANAVLTMKAAAAPFTREVLGRLLEHDTVLRRMVEVNDGRVFPLAPKERLEAARRMMSDL